MSAIVEKNGRVRQLDRQIDSITPVSENDVQNPQTLVYILLYLFRDLARLTGIWRPRRIDYEGREVDGTGTTIYRFPHGFKGRVRWWPVDWSGATTESRLVRHSSTDNNTLALVSYASGTVTLRVEEAG